MDEKRRKRLPPKAKEYLNLVKECYSKGFKPLSKAMIEATRIWKNNKLK